MDNITKHQEKPLHKLLEDIIGTSIVLQLKGVEVAKPYIQGKPGGGKTASLVAMCKKYNWNLLHLHLPLMPIEDISGLPQFEQLTVNGEKVQGTRWTFPEILSELYKLTEEKIKDPQNGKIIPKPCILFLDDWHLASPSHLALGFELFSERKLRTYKIPDNVAFVLAGNNSQKAGIKTQNSAITNRVALYPIETSFEHWKFNYAIQNGINDKVLAFLGNETYQRFFHEDEVVNMSWGSPRSWTYLSNLLNEMEDMSPNGEVVQSMLSYITNAHVSNTASAEFVSFYHIYSKTQMDKVFDGKKAVKCPDKELDKYIYMIAAGNEYVHRSKKKENSENKNKLQKLIEKVCEITCAISKHNPEIAISGIKSIMDTEVAIAEKQNGKTSYVEIAKMLKIMKSNISSQVSKDIRRLAG